MKKTLPLIVLATLISSCATQTGLQSTSATPISAEKTVETTGQVTKVTWPRLVEIVKTGNYKMVGQQHNNLVRVVLNNGDVVEAYQPEIDAILKVIEDCAQCKGKPILSE